MASPISQGAGGQRSTVSVSVDVVRYDPALGVGTFWDEGTRLRVEVWESPERTVVISGNAVGLVSLARHLLALTQVDVPDGRHLDFDTYGGWLDEGSSGLRIELDKR
jgi:hypothetical protein